MDDNTYLIFGIVLIFLVLGFLMIKEKFIQDIAESPYNKKQPLYNLYYYQLRLILGGT